MNTGVLVSIVVLSLAVLVLIVDKILVNRSLKDVSSQLENILGSDTNTLLSFCGISRSVRKLTSVLNVKLSQIRKKELKVGSRGNELSGAIVNIAHDLRTPLTAISGYIEILEKNNLDDESEKCVAVIKERTDTLKNLTNELFGFSLISSDNTELKKENLSLKSELETAIAASYTILVNKNIEPEISLSDKTETKSLDSEALQRIFGNILSNAAKYSDGDLSITLDDDGTITFSNSASGLSEVEVGKLFDRFYTVSNARTSTGLGLSIAKILTERMDGKISAKYLDGKLLISIKF